MYFVSLDVTRVYNSIQKTRRAVESKDWSFEDYKVVEKKDSVFYIIHIIQNLKNTIKNPKISNISKIK